MQYKCTYINEYLSNISESIVFYRLNIIYNVRNVLANSKNNMRGPDPKCLHIVKEVFFIFAGKFKEGLTARRRKTTDN